jgi:hypothetical protein
VCRSSGGATTAVRSTVKNPSAIGSDEGAQSLTSRRSRKREAKTDSGDTSWKKCRSCENHWILQSSEEIKDECLPTL